MSHPIPFRLMTVRRIDLNADLGEDVGPGAMAGDAAILQIVSSANVACGGHAGDSETMFKTVSLAAAEGVQVGAHPGYVDREGFGRRVIPMSLDELGRIIAAQVGSLQAIAALAGAQVSYVKAHGALANLAAREREVADRLVSTVRQIDPELAVLAISGTQIERAARALDVPVFSEVFADRGYLANGQLVPRGEDGDLIHDPGVAVERMRAFLESGHMPVVDGDPIPLQAHSICVHGDTPGAVELARQLRTGLERAGVEVVGFGDDARASGGSDDPRVPAVE